MDATLKACKSCGESKPFDQYVRAPRMADGHENQCKSCRAKLRREQNAERAARPADYSVIPPKNCSKCGVSKPAIEFSRDHNRADGLSARCKSCWSQTKSTALQNRKQQVVSTAIIPASQNRSCRTCGEMKPLATFPKRVTNPEGRSNECKTCTNQRARLNPNRSSTSFSSRLRQRYGISPEEYDRMYTQQNGLCAICQKPETLARDGKPLRLAVDHDHETGNVRELLCYYCNQLLGWTQDSTDRILRMAEYLKRHGAHKTY